MDLNSAIKSKMRSKEWVGTKKLGENLKLLDGNQWLTKILLVHLLIVHYTIFMIEDREFVIISRNNPVLIFFFYSGHLLVHYQEE